MKEGAVINILNALARVQNEYLVLDVDKWARITPSNTAIEDINGENDVSSIKYANPNDKG